MCRPVCPRAASAGSEGFYGIKKKKCEKFRGRSLMGKSRNASPAHGGSLEAPQFLTKLGIKFNLHQPQTNTPVHIHLQILFEEGIFRTLSSYWQWDWILLLSDIALEASYNSTCGIHNIRDSYLQWQWFPLVVWKVIVMTPFLLEEIWYPEWQM